MEETSLPFPGFLTGPIVVIISIITVVHHSHTSHLAGARGVLGGEKTIFFLL